MIEGLASAAAEVAENSGNAGGLEIPSVDTSRLQDFSGKNDSPDSSSSGEMNFSNDSLESDNGGLETSQAQDYSGDGVYDSEYFASEKDGNKESKGQTKENAVAEENKPKDSDEQSESKNGEENTDTSKECLKDEEKDKINQTPKDVERGSWDGERGDSNVYITKKVFIKYKGCFFVFVKI